MVHLRYIKKNGKTYGPYSYKTVRTKDGKIKNIYLGKHETKRPNNVVQTVFLALIMIFSLFILISLFQNSEMPTGFVVLENHAGENIGNYDINQVGEKYDILITKEEQTESNIELQGLEEIPEKISAKIGRLDDKSLKTEVFAIDEEFNFDKAILKLKKIGDVDHIKHCQNFNIETFECEEWQKTDIPFLESNDYIEFEVTHFTAYAGGGIAAISSNLTIWDDTDSEGGSNLRYSEGCVIPATCNTKGQVNFFANYTNNTGGFNTPINTSSSNCSISFNLNLTATPAWTAYVNMSFNSLTSQYEYNRSFTYRGIFDYNISCIDNEYDNNATLDTFQISNSEPYIVQDPLPDMQCNEDTWCYLNFSDNCTEPDVNDADSLSYAINDSSFSTLYFDTASGNLSVFVTNESEVFSADFLLTVTDGIASDAANLGIIVSAVNDTPIFSSISNQKIYEDSANYSLNLSTYYSDEENDPGYFTDNDSITVDIYYSPSPNATNGEMIYLYPSNSEVGNYSLNITVNDTYGNNVSQVVNFEVINTNDAPIMDYVCLNETNHTATEDIEFNCTVNATDDDLIWGDNLTFTANETWFTFDWLSNNQSQVNFTQNDYKVGFWWINITVTDSFSAIDSKLINITLENVTDEPALSEIGNFTVYGNASFSFTINATDEDLNIPSTGEVLKFSVNDTSLFTLGTEYIVGNITYTNTTFTPTTAGDFWINFSVNDTDGTTKSEIVNISVRMNTPPNLSATVNNNVTEDVEFYYNMTLNVTDADGDVVNWTDNTTLFDIDIDTGEINFTANDSYVGENWVNITVTDLPPNSSASQVLNFTVYNVEDMPNFTEAIGNHTATEDTQFNLQINATDEDLYIPSSNLFNITENLTFAVNDTSLFNLSQPSATTATITFTATNESQVGLYWFEINVTDRLNYTFNETINITIVSVNDAPSFTDYDNITDAQQNVLLYYDFNASDEENGSDTINGTGNLTFWIQNISNASGGDLMNGVTLTPSFFNNANEVLNSTTGVLTFVPNSTHAGTGTGIAEYSINISVNDTDNVIDSIIINLSIANENDPPILLCALLTATGFSNSQSVTIYENTSNVTFRVLNVQDDDGDTLNFNWTLDGVLNESDSVATEGSTPTASDNFSYDPGFSDSGVHNLTLIVDDGINTSVDSWPGGSYTTCYRNITVLETNSPPTFILTIQNISWNEDTDNSNLDLDDHFYDVENQTELNFTFDHLDENFSTINESSITVTIDNATHIVTFSPDTDWSGQEYIIFHANDSIDNISSNYVKLNVSPVAPDVVTTPGGGGGGGGGGGSVTKLVTIDMIHPGALTIYKDDLIVTPLIIKNSNEDITLREINLEAEVFGSLEVALSETYIAALAPGDQKEIDISLMGKSTGFEEVIIRAKVTDPEVVDSAKIFATIVERPEEVIEKIRFVKDLFKENPECLELNELVIRAENDLAENNYQAALEKVNLAISKCKDLISTLYREEETSLPKTINTRRFLFLLGLNLFAAVFIITLIKIFMKMRKKEGAS